MKISLTLVRAVVVLLALAAAGTGAQAATITHVTDLGLQPGVVTGLGTGAVFAFYDGTVLVPEFDPSLGALQSVDFLLEISIASEIDYQPGAVVAPNGGVNLNLSTVGVGDLIDGPRFVFEVLTCTSDCTVTRLATISRSNSLPLFDLSSFTGTGDVLVDYAISESYADCCGSGGHTITGFRSSSSATLTTTYTFVPEPGTAVLLGSGLVLLGIPRRCGRGRS